MPLESVKVSAPGGAADAVLARPAGAGTRPGVLLFPDGIGMRREFEEIAQRVADQGYVVLTPNIYYRTGKPPFFQGPVDFTNPQTMAHFRSLTSSLGSDAMAGDGRAYLDFLAAQPGVRRGSMAVVGFCFTGQFALRVAAAEPGRIAAAASFHGGRLVVDGDASPHLLIPRVKARLYFGHAENDTSMPAEAIAKLEAALTAWGGTWDSQVYQGARHGWMVHGRDVYHAEQAQRGFGKLFDLLRGVLG